MMGFIQDRAHAVAKAGTAGDNDTHLFFGCRTHDERMYRETLEEWEQKSVLNMHLALSRDSILPKQYVQDSIQANAELVCKLLSRTNCRYYVCGDARMADHCYEAIIEALRKHGPMSRAKATQLLKRLRVEDRWQYDLWGISAYMDEGPSYSDTKSKIAKRNGNRALTWLSKMKQTDHDESLDIPTRNARTKIIPADNKRMAKSGGRINGRTVDLPFDKSSGSGPCHASADRNPGNSRSETGCEEGGMAGVVTEVPMVANANGVGRVKGVIGLGTVAVSGNQLRTLRFLACVAEFLHKST